MLSEQQRKEREAQVKREKAERLEASNTRKKEMQDLEMTRRQNEKPSDLEQVCVCVFSSLISMSLSLLSLSPGGCRKGLRPAGHSQGSDGGTGR